MTARRFGYRVTKRAFDIAASFLGLLILSPVFLVTAIAIFLDDPGITRVGIFLRCTSIDELPQLVNVLCSVDRADGTGSEGAERAFGYCSAASTDQPDGREYYFLRPVPYT